jgi:hypothetical protein
MGCRSEVIPINLVIGVMMVLEGRMGSVTTNLYFVDLGFLSSSFFHGWSFGIVSQ